MLLFTLSVLMCSIIANSGAQREQVERNEGRNPQQSYEVTKEIKNLVPVDFAAANLRESRLKFHSNRNVLLYSQDANHTRRRPLYLLTRRFKENSTDRPNRKFEKFSRRKFNKNNLITAAKKSSRFRNDGFKDSQTSTSSTTTIPTRETSRFKYGRPQMYKSSNSVITKSEMMANIRKAINSLPEQLVTVVRDDSDCNDNHRIKLTDVRGPPCSLSVRLTQSAGDPWFSPRNVITRNWKLFGG